MQSTLIILSLLVDRSLLSILTESIILRYILAGLFLYTINCRKNYDTLEKPLSKAICFQNIISIGVLPPSIHDIIKDKAHWLNHPVLPPPRRV